MKQDNRMKKQQGFTLIELVVVIAILAILAAFALPRFAQLSEQAHRSSIQGTAGALSAGVALTKVQWVSNGLSAATENVQGFGNDDVDVSVDGWPTGINDNLSPNLSTTQCREVWTGVLQSNAPTISVTAPDYAVTALSGNCVFTYQLDGNGSNIGYDADTGGVSTTLN